MKKLLLGCLLSACVCSGLYADPVEDTQFKQYVELTRNHESNPEGMTVSSDATYRIIYAAMPIPMNKSDVTPEVIGKMKEQMLKEIAKEKADCKVIRDLKIRIVYTFITSDKDVFSISLSYKDL